MAALGEIPFGLYYGSVDATPLFVMLAGLYAQRTGRLCPDPRAVARHRARAGLDRRCRRSRRRRLRRVRARRRDGSRQPGLEGLPRRRVPRRRPPGRGADRAGRAAGVRLCRQAPGGRLRAQARQARARRCSWRPRRTSCVVRFDEAFWCEEIGTYALALDGAKAQCKVRTSNAGHALATGIALPRPRSPRRRAADATLVLFRLGHPHRRHGRGALQPDVLSQRIDLAARQRPDRAGLGALRQQARRRRGVRGPGAGDQLHGQPAHAGALLRLPAPAGPRPHALSRRVLAAGVGGGRAVLHAAGDAGSRRSIRPRAISAWSTRPCPRSPASHRAQLSLAGASVDFVVRQDGEAISLQVLRTRGDLQVSLVFNAHSADG